jgi:thiamine pyrophosphate-dependent acetolactate synthase large subunit-like protein
MKRTDVIRTIVQVLKDNSNVAIISSTGLISRELFSINDSPQNFYMTGSMGLASSIGLGLAIALQNKKIVVIEGDGSLLMNLGSLASIGHFSPPNLVHIVLDNESYDSSAGEPTISNTARLDELAKITGYRIVRKVTKGVEIQKAIEEALREKGPTFLLIKIEKGGERNLPRILNLEEVKTRFMEFLHRNFIS